MRVEQCPDENSTLGLLPPYNFRNGKYVALALFGSEFGILQKNVLDLQVTSSIKRRVTDLYKNLQCFVLEKAVISRKR